MSALAGDTITELLKDAHGILLANPGNLWHSARW